MNLPATLAGWVAVAGGIVAIAATVLGGVIATVRRYVCAAVQEEVHAQVPAAVAGALREVNAKLDGVRVNLTELSGEIAVVRRLEKKIENGLASRTAVIEQRQTVLIEQVAEIHGWLAASRPWDGTERRVP